MGVGATSQRCKCGGRLEVGAGPGYSLLTREGGWGLRKHPASGCHPAIHGVWLPHDPRYCAGSSARRRRP